MFHKCLPTVFLVLLLIPSNPARASETLKALGDAYWESNMKNSPTWATSLGDHRYDDSLSDISAEGYTFRRGELEAFLDRAEKIDPQTLDKDDRITLHTLLFQLRSSLATMECETRLWNIGPRSGPQANLMSIASYHYLQDDPQSGRDMVKRWEQFASYTHQHMANLREGLAQGKVASKGMVERVVSMLTELEGTPVKEWAALKTPLESMPQAWSSSDRKVFEEGIRKAVDAYRLALLEYNIFLKADLLPHARGENQPGLSHLPGGDACYQSLVFQYTTLDLSPEAIHQMGLVEVERVNQETRELGKDLLGTDDLETIHAMLRNDPALHFTTREEVQDKAEEALARARETIKDFFGVLPQADCIVTPMEPHEEKYSTIAYYRNPTTDGEHPGRYFINTYAPETRPRFEAEALAFHEAIPGHHLQIAIAQELTNVPKFRKHSGATAFVEGWGLYSERLANEMGLYSSDLDRMGMLSYDSWRACRLVVDTGIHALGWTRRQAIDFMVANSCLAENNIANEVDRYISTPGQALAYKIGQKEIFRLRAKAKLAMGDRFSLKDFHDMVLSQGAVDLSTLGAMVDEYIAGSM